MNIHQIAHRVKLRDLETLMAVVRERTMHKASLALHLSQPAVSKAIRELENAIGLQLFERSVRGVEPTEFGRAFAAHAKVVIDEMHRALRALDQLSDPERGEVRFACAEALSGGLASAAIHRATLEFPGTRYLMETGQPQDMVEHFLLERKVDFVLTRPHSLPLPEGVTGEPLFNDFMQAVVGASSPFAKKKRITLNDLKDEYWILARHELHQTSPVSEKFAQVGLALPSRIVETGSLAGRYSLLNSGRFVTVMPHSLLRYRHDPTAICVLPISTFPWGTPTMILTLLGRTPSHAALRFINVVRELSQSLKSASVTGKSKTVSRRAAIEH
jgi:DNA-binding transcriptional LysR family regulator